MMSRKQWLALLCCFVCYIMFGATVFYTIESKQEEKRVVKELKEKHDIEDMINKDYKNETYSHSELFYKISKYCDKPMGEHVPETTMDMKWTFYHSTFYTLTLVSTIGYGNLSPSTAITKTFMILFGFLGIPINGFVFITLGRFFQKNFLKLREKLKKTKSTDTIRTLDLVGRVIFYLIIGFMMFIIIPSLLIASYEDWPYYMAIEFTFGTLSTIGAGSNIPGTKQHDYSTFVFILYRMFIFVWLLLGIGYLAMIFGFITRMLQSKRIRSLEHSLSQNINKTNRKIVKTLRTMLNEFLLTKIKVVYQEKPITELKLRRSNSCPNLTQFDIMYAEDVKFKRRAISEYTMPQMDDLKKAPSDTNLDNIDKMRTFVFNDGEDDSKKFILKVANALSKYEKNHENDEFELENADTNIFGFTSKNVSEMRPRSASESRKEKPSAILKMPWYTSSKTRKVVEKKETEKYGKCRSRTLPPLMNPQNLIKKIKDTFTSDHTNENVKFVDLENQRNESVKRIDQQSRSKINESVSESFLEETSLAEFIQALTAINISSLDSGVEYQKKRRLPIKPTVKERRVSAFPTRLTGTIRDRRQSLCPDYIKNSQLTTSGYVHLNERDEIHQQSIIQNDLNSQKIKKKKVSFHHENTSVWH